MYLHSKELQANSLQDTTKLEYLQKNVLQQNNERRKKQLNLFSIYIL